MEVCEYKEPREEGRVVIQPSLAMKGFLEHGISKD
ncbi:unnamed protein product [Brassica oleracea]